MIDADGMIAVGARLSIDRTRVAIDLDDVSHQVDDPVVRDASASVVHQLSPTVESESRIGYFDDEQRVRRMIVKVIVDVAFDDRNVWLRFGMASQSKRELNPDVS